jgi:hypothetical protein
MSIADDMGTTPMVDWRARVVIGPIAPITLLSSASVNFKPI